MIRTIEKLDRYRYIVNDIVVTLPGSSEPITILGQGVQTIMINKNYDEENRPRIELAIQVQKDIYKKLAGKMNNASMLLSIDKYIEKGDGSTIKFKSNLLKKTLKCMNKDIIEMNNISQLKKTPDNVEESNTQDTVLLKVFLFDNTQLNNYKKLGSLHFDGTVTDALYHSFSRRGLSNILMSPLEGDGSHKIDVPHDTLRQNIEFLDAVYGIYNTPYLLFMDYDFMYFLDRGKVGTTTRPQELGIVNMYLEEHGTHEATDIGCSIDAANKYYVVNLNNVPGVVDIDENIEYAVNSGVSGIVTGGSSYQSSATAVNVSTKNNVVVNNSKILHQEAYKVKDMSRYLRIDLGDVDVSIFTPNKQYSLITHQSYETTYGNIKGNYRLGQVGIFLTREGESDLQANVSCIMKKVM